MRRSNNERLLIECVSDVSQRPDGGPSITGEVRLAGESFETSNQQNMKPSRFCATELKKPPLRQTAPENHETIIISDFKLRYCVGHITL